MIRRRAHLGGRVYAKAGPHYPRLMPRRRQLPSIGLDDLLGYERWLRASGYRPDTVSRAVRIARMFLCALKGRPPDRRMAEEFMASAAERVKRVTLLNYYRDLRQFFGWALSEGLVDNNPLSLIQRPRPSLSERERDTRHLPYLMEEFEALVMALPYWNWVGLRDTALLWTFWDTPLRVGEVIALHVEDLDWGLQELSVRDGKAGVKYEAVLGSEAILALDRYLRHRPEESERLFVDRHSQALTRHAVEQMMRRTAQRAGWVKPCRPHDFRHSWRVRMLRLGLSDAHVSALMGHRNVIISQSYARQAVRQDAKAVLRQRLNAP